MFNSIKIKPSYRVGYMDKFVEGEIVKVEHKTNFADIIIDEKSLFEEFKKYDLISTLGCFVDDFKKHSVERLLLESPSELENNRQQIYICPLCGDIYCGAITCLIDRDGEVVVWRDFRFENGDIESSYVLKNSKTYRFLWTEYEPVIRSTLNM
ncbi:oxidoreductase [Brevibacillus sp. SYSU BS000544]|uniref:oxidoreductase n=1 Tax=Brevibacillus sp. SYSU BS000544 TaxID=3416443 RepID=UPI003CE556E1